MPLTTTDVDFQTELPELPDAVQVPQLSAVSLDERRQAIGALTERLGLGDVKRVETMDSIAFVSERGEVEYFPASGAVWARDATTERTNKSELRRWDGIEEIRDGDDTRFALDREMTGRVVRDASALLDTLGFVEEDQGKPRVVLDQVAELDEEGQTITAGAGSASVIYDYDFAGLPVMGAGGKTQLYADPARGGIQITGGFHVWRRPGEVAEIPMRGVKDALGVGVLRDPELMKYQEQGARIEITHLRFGYLALPAMVRQQSLFPAFQVEGRVHVARERDYFEFARYHHAAAPDQYAGAGLFDPQLAIMN